jgi:hypothetical protein
MGKVAYQHRRHRALKMMLPTGRTAELRNLQFSEELDCWTVRCGCCHEDLPADEEFYSQDGRLPASWCKACRAEKFRSWYRRTGSAQRKAAREAAHG